MDKETAESVLTLIGLGLARVLSYAYGGFLALVIARILDPSHTAAFFGNLPWGLIILVCFVVGAGLYRAHRSLVIPIHHLFGCFLFWFWDKLNGTAKEESVSPTRWLNSLRVARCRRILAYNVLRHDPDFMTSEEQERLNLLHAEFGLVVMAAEACFIGAAYARWHVSSHAVFWVWLATGFVLLVASYPAPLQQHATECLRWRIREKSGIVSETLKKYGLLKAPNA
jgi:hypothetical protein